MALRWNDVATGAATGAGLGAPGGLLGSGVGALAGGVLGLFGGGRSKKPKIKYEPDYDPGQMELLNQLTQGVQGGNKNALEYLNSILSGEEGAFQDFEAPYKQQFEQEVIPGILERFSGAGARSSSGIQQALASAGKDLSTNLAAQRAQLKQGAINQLLGFNREALTKKNSRYMQEGRPSFFQQLSGPASTGASQGIEELLSWLKNQGGI
jgi:hypothetical protein